MNSLQKCEHRGSSYKLLKTIEITKPVSTKNVLEKVYQAEERLILSPTNKSENNVTRYMKNTDKKSTLHSKLKNLMSNLESS